MPFSPIVPAGPNSANPHAAPPTRVSEHGDLLLFDWGAAVHGYSADVPRPLRYG